MDSIAALMQLLSIGALFYGAILVFRYWKTTVPLAASSDAEFAHHHVAGLSG